MYFKLYSIELQKDFYNYFNNNCVKWVPNF